MSVAPAPDPLSGKRVLGLDILRAFASLGVAGSHALPALYHYVPYLWFLGALGAWGVELFFVLSGFLIGRILIRAGESMAEMSGLGLFYSRRWLRTIPLFVAFYFVNVTLNAGLLGVHFSIPVLAGHLFFVRNLASLHLRFMEESWSLAVEEWFYLLFPAALWLGLRIVRKFDPVFLLTAAAFFLFSFGARFIWAYQHPAALWYNEPRETVIFRFDALMTGIFAAWISIRTPASWRKYRRSLGWIGLAISLPVYFSMWTYHHGFAESNPHWFFSQTYRFTFISVGFALMLPWASQFSVAKETLLTSTVRRLALWSYVLYLLHLPWYALVRYFGIFANNDTFAKGLGLFAVTFGLALPLSGLVYQLVERPSMVFREKATHWYINRFPSADRHR